MQKPEIIAVGVRIDGIWKAAAFRQPTHKKPAQAVK